METIKVKIVYELSKARMRAMMMIYILDKISKTRDMNTKEKAIYWYSVMEKWFCDFRLNQIKKAIDNKSLETSSIA